MLASSLTGYPDPRSNRSIQTLGRLFRATRRAERNRSSSIPTLWVDGWMLAMDANMAAINLRSLEQLPTQTAGGAMQGTRSKRFARGWARPREAHLADSTQVQTPGLVDWWSCAESVELPVGLLGARAIMNGFVCTTSHAGKVHIRIYGPCPCPWQDARNAARSTTC